MSTYTISRDGEIISSHTTYVEALAQLHRIQGQSADWAMKHEGYAIEVTFQSSGLKS